MIQHALEISRRALPVVLAGAVFTTVGCVSYNERSTIGDGRDAFHPEALTETTRPDTQLQDDPPSTVTLERDSWGTQRIVVPVDGVAHLPRWATNSGTNRETARQRGDFPTALSALELTGSDNRAQFHDYAMSPVNAAKDFFMLFIAWYDDPVWTEHRGTSYTYWRAPTFTARPVKPVPTRTLPPRQEEPPPAEPVAQEPAPQQVPPPPPTGRESRP